MNAVHPEPRLADLLVRESAELLAIGTDEDRLARLVGHPHYIGKVGDQPPVLLLAVLQGLAVAGAGGGYRAR